MPTIRQKSLGVKSEGYNNDRSNSTCNSYVFAIVVFDLHCLGNKLSSSSYKAVFSPSDAAIGPRYWLCDLYKVVAEQNFVYNAKYGRHKLAGWLLHFWPLYTLNQLPICIWIIVINPGFVHYYILMPKVHSISPKQLQTLSESSTPCCVLFTVSNCGTLFKTTFI